MVKKNKKHPLSAEELRKRLADRYPAPEWVLLNEVRDATGWEGNRSADCVALATWPSRGCQLFGFEIKSSRSDVLKELRDPAKADGVMCRCHRWFLVVGSTDLIKDSELPKNWGLIAPSGKGLRVVDEGRLLKPKPWPREFVASLVRNAHQNQASVSELQKEYQRGLDEARTRDSWELKRVKEDLNKLRERVKLYEDVVGTRVISDRYSYEGKLREEAATIKAIMTAGPSNYYQSMARLVLQMETLSRSVREGLVSEGALPEKPRLDDLCPHPARHGRHELYVSKIDRRQKINPKDAALVFCRACGAEGPA